MLISRLVLVLTVWAVIFQAPPVQAQEFSLPGNQFLVGAKIEVSFSVPELDPQTVYDIGIAREGSDELAGPYYIGGAQTGNFEMVFPADPGPYQVVMKQRDGPVVQRIPVTLFFTPTPGALSVSANRATIGETVTINVRLQEGRYYDGPWVGLFDTGRNVDGGAAIADNRRTWDWVPGEGGLTFKMPRWPGTYEVRLFDRRNGPYVLDRQLITVVADAAPGMLALDQETYEVGEEMRITATLDRDRYFGSVWVGLFEKSATLSGGARREEDRLRWDWLNKETMSVSLNAPNVVGSYEIRIFDRNEQFQFELDRVGFNVQASPQPGAIDLQRKSFIIGEAITIPITLASGRFYGSPWMGLFETATEPDIGNARRSLRRLTWDWVKTEQSTTFTAPAWPGTYQLRLYDREGSFYKIDTYEISVTAPATPGAIVLNKTRFEIGEPIVVTSNLDGGRFYSSPWIGIFDPGGDQVAGGAQVDRTRLSWNWVTDGEPDTLPGISEPGTYQVRLFDRESSGYVLDTVEFQVVATVVPDVLTTDKSVYKPGEAIIINVDIPQPRYTASPWVGLFLADAYGPQNAPTNTVLKTWDWISVGGGPYNLVAPTIQSTYRIAAFDRQNGEDVILGEKIIKIVSEPEDLLRIQQRQYRPGETIKFQTRWPESLTLVSPKISMFSSSFVTAGGGLAIELPIKTRFVNRGREQVEFSAPLQEGAYELRFIDRDSYFYVLDIEEFTVQDTAVADASRRPFRLTPMPGEGRSGPAGEDGLPGEPRLPSDGDGDGGGDGGSDGGNDDSDAPAGEPGSDNEPGAGNDDDGGAPETGAAEPEPADNDGAPVGEEQGDDEIQPPDLAVLMVGPGGFVPVTKLEPGQSFLVEARFAAPPDELPVTAQVSLGGGTVIDVALRPDGESGVYRSGVIRIPTGGEN